MIYYLEDSKIIEEGNFDELIKKNSKFNKLYTRQVKMEVDSYEA